MNTGEITESIARRWSRAYEWTPEQAAMLILGLDPEAALPLRTKEMCARFIPILLNEIARVIGSRAAARYGILLSETEYLLSLSRRKLPTPAQWLKWAELADWPLPRELVDACSTGPSPTDERPDAPPQGDPLPPADPQPSTETVYDTRLLQATRWVITTYWEGRNPADIAATKEIVVEKLMALHGLSKNEAQAVDLVTRQDTRRNPGR